MKPKKTIQNDKTEEKPIEKKLHEEYETFLQAFERPTTIYKYMGVRHKLMPLFLHRTLTYMPKSDHIAGDTKYTKIDDLALSIANAKLNVSPARAEILKLELFGLSGNDIKKDGQVEVEVLLRRLSHKRRKDGFKPVGELPVGQATIPCVAGGLVPSDTVATIQIPPGSFSPNGCAIRAFSLVFLVKGLKDHLKEKVQPKTSKEDSSPPVKRRKTRSTTAGDSDSDKPATPVPAPIPPPPEPHYSKDLPVYNQKHRCVLETAEYEVRLWSRCDGTEDTNLTIKRGNRSAPAKQESESCLQGTKLSFRVSWHDAEPRQSPRRCNSGSPHKAYINGVQVNSKLPVSPPPTPTRGQDPAGPRTPQRGAVGTGLTGRDQPSTSVLQTNKGIRLEDTEKHNPFQKEYEMFLQGASRPTLPLHSVQCSMSLGPESPSRLFYYFLYNNKIVHQTQARYPLACPWCSRCLFPCLSVLLRHLRNSHARLNFIYSASGDSGRVDVSINEHFDGSYEGNPQDCRTYLSLSGCRFGPTRRTPVTQLLVYKPSRSKPTLSEFTEAENDLFSYNQYIHGHNRLYYHSDTLHPLRPCEIDHDSEDENDPEWLRQRTVHMIDDFTDVNEGEKALMKMWNLHVMKHNLVGDLQLPRACEHFTETHGARILEENLSRNLLLHLVNMFDFGLIRGDVISRCMRVLYSMETGKEEKGGLKNSGTILDRTSTPAETSTKTKNESLRDKVKKTLDKI